MTSDIEGVALTLLANAKGILAADEISPYRARCNSTASRGRCTEEREDAPVVSPVRRIAANGMTSDLAMRSKTCERVRDATRRDGVEREWQAYQYDGSPPNR